MLFGMACILQLMESLQSLFKFAKFALQGEIFISDFIAIVKLCQGQLYNLYYDATLPFQGNEFWSFHELLQDDHGYSLELSVQIWLFLFFFQNVVNETPETTILHFFIKKFATRTCCLAALFSVEITNKKCKAKKVIFWGC